MTDELPPGWVTTSVGEIIEARNGRAFKSTEWRQRGTPIIRIQNLKATDAAFNYFDGMLEEKHAIRSGDLLFAWSGTPGTSFGAHVWKGEDAALNQHIFRLDFDRGAFNADYLRHALNQNVTRYIEQAQGGVGLAHISKSKFDASLLRIPPTNEQNRIVDRLDELFSCIEEGERALRRVQKLVERYRQSVLKAAITGELTREWREKNKDELESGEALLSRIVKARREAWEKAELGKMKAKGITPANGKWKQKYQEPSDADTSALPALPDGWAWASAEAVCESVHSGTTPERPLLQATPSSGVPFIKVYNLTFDGSLDFSIDPTYVNADHHRKHMSRSRTLPGDVLTNIVGPPLGKVSVVPSTSAEWNINQAVVGFRLLSGMRNDLMSIYLQSEVAKGWLRSTTKTTTSQVNLAVTTCRRLPVPIPPEHEQERICELVKKALSYADDMLAAIRGSSSRSSSLRQSTLKAAFGGQLVSQDPADEPATALLERIAAERGADNAVPKRGRKKKTAA